MHGTAWLGRAAPGVVGGVVGACRSAKLLNRVEMHEAQGMPTPRRIRLDERAIEVAEVRDQWFGADYRYCKIRGEMLLQMRAGRLRTSDASARFDENSVLHL